METNKKVLGKITTQRCSVTLIQSFETTKVTQISGGKSDTVQSTLDIFSKFINTF